MKTIEFTKMVASGNDFILMTESVSKCQGVKVSEKSGLRNLAKKICDRHYGVGADGLLVIEKSKKADFRMRIFNADGSEAEMCGNGARCAAMFARENGISGNTAKFETMAGIIEAEVSGDIVKLKMSDPADLRREVGLIIEGEEYRVHFVNTGVPHAIVFVEDLDSWDVKRLGREIRRHKAFAPKGTNADFVEVTRKNLLAVRTYERGVEDETLACGTGVTAAAIISAAVKDFKSPVTCLTKSGDKLKVYFRKTGDKFTDVYLEGGARRVFSGAYPR